MVKGQSIILNLLEKLEKEKRQTLIATFPFQLWDLMEIMEKQGKTLDLGETNSYVITAGGWKIYEFKKVTEMEFAKKIEKNLGIPADNYRDLYGMSEMNGLAFSCEARYKHVTPWIYPMVLDDNLEPIGYGEWGRLAFLDPAGYSYPGFIMTGDRVKMLEECPECNKTGVVLESEITRVTGAEARGCGDLMRELITEELGKE
jgi:long-chain-fatty-acid---luciferin-component ligase